MGCGQKSRRKKKSLNRDLGDIISEDVAQSRLRVFEK